MKFVRAVAMDPTEYSSLVEFEQLKCVNTVSTVDFACNFGYFLSFLAVTLGKRAAQAENCKVFVIFAIFPAHTS